VGDGPVIKSYAVLERIPIQEMFQIENMSDLHHNLIDQYRKQNWAYCLDALSHLIGRWNGEIDSFYRDLESRINDLKDQDLGDQWTWAIERSLG